MLRSIHFQIISTLFIEDSKRFSNRINLLENEIANLSLGFILDVFSERRERAINILILNLLEQKSNSNNFDAVDVAELFNVF